MSQEATIRRGVRNARYAAIPNHVFEDARLSMEARWLLSYLLSKPDNWTVVIGDIVKKGNCGRDKARKMIAELVEFGYAEREQQREEGKFGSSVMVIYDEPSVGISSANSGPAGSVTFLPQTDLPATVLPCTVLPSPVKTSLSNNSDLANTEKQNLREGGREDFEGEDPKAIEKDFWLVIKDWPGFAGMPKDNAKREWFALTAEQRTLAQKRRDPWFALLKAQKKSHTPAPSTYFREKLFDEVSDEPVARQAAGSGGTIPVPPLGPLWGSLRAVSLLRGAVSVELPEDLRGAIKRTYLTVKKASESRAAGYLRGKNIDIGGDGELVFPDDFEQAEWRRRVRDDGYPEVNRLHSLARQRDRGSTEARFAGLADLCEPVKVGDEIFEAWRAHHEAAGWPFVPVPDAGSMPVVWFPKGGPDGLDEFHKAARAVMAKERGDEHAA